MTISSNVESVHSITASDPLVISGGGLTVAANSTISGGLTMTGGSLTANGSEISLTVTGTTTVSGGNLYAENGASLSLNQLTSYTGNGSHDHAGGDRHGQHTDTGQPGERDAKEATTTWPRHNSRPWPAAR